ncbi:MAG: phosphatidate cytidylyltransferase [Nitrospirae bacterium]|nr:phosphatidate cytidylyltransferase [Nitrospirota bacterium]
MHLKRLVVALLIVPPFYLAIMYLPAEFFFFLLSFFSTLALFEFYTMFRLDNMMKYSGIIAGAALLAVFFLAPWLFSHALLLSVLTIMSLRLFLKKDPASSLSAVSTAVIGLLYIPGLLSFQMNLYKAAPAWIILLYASVWASDSMAYYIGKGFGKRKLYEAISPNKTVAGAFGSVGGGMLGIILVKTALLPHISLAHAVLIGAVVGVTTIVGDLVESMFKRDAGVKDSSGIIPGHGGVLDKLDGVTFAGPAFYWVCVALGLLR